jgi:diguanylate cyclase (GGDEF)-like protein/PAS domain S-box-containing protein
MPFFSQRVEPNFRRFLDIRGILSKQGAWAVVLSCAVSAALMVLALWLRMGLAAVSAGLQYLTFFPAVAIAAMLGGYRSGIFATLLGLVFATCIFTAPYYTLSFEVLRASFWPNLVFLADGVLISFAIEAMYRYRMHFERALRQAHLAQAELEHSASQHKRILDNLFCFVALLDTEGHVLEMNQAPLLRSGRVREDSIGKPFCEGPWWVYDEAVHAQLIQAMHEARQGRSKRYDVAVMMGSELVHIDFQISPIFNSLGDVVALLPTAVEITDRKRAEEHMQAVSERLALATQAGGVGIWDWDLPSNIVVWDDQTFALYGVTRGDFATATEAWLCSLLPQDKAEAEEDIRRALRGEVDYDTEFRVRWPDGSIHCIRSIAKVKRDAKGLPLRMVGTNWDITKEREQQRELNIAAVTFNSHEGIMIVDADECILRVNKSFEVITGYTAEEVIGQSPRILSSGRHDMAFFKAMWDSITTTGFWQGEIWDRRKSGEVYPKWTHITAVKDANGQLTEYVGTFTDITVRKQSEDKIHNLAFYDALTGFPNRRLLQDRLHQVVVHNERTHDSGALLVINLDNFKALNDSKGHERGDLLLQQAGARILGCTREGDTVARIGGDEFVVLLTDLHRAGESALEQARLLAQKLLDALSQSYQLAGYAHRCTASIGITLLGARRDSEEDLMRQADIALHQAKLIGKNTIQFFDPKMQDAVNMRVQLEHELQQAVEESQFRLYYQVQLDNDNHAIGAEALIRWLHPERGLVPPVQFVPIAESSGLIVKIGRWVLETACQQLRAWDENPGTQHLILAINVSACEFEQQDFVDTVERLLKQHRIDPSRLKLELTESVIVSDIGEVIKKMHALKALGVRISLDDFGTGYSSLSYLKRLPIDQLKIDQSFVRDIVSDPGDAVMVKTIIELAKNFGLNVIAEGVETQAQFDYLKAHGCMAYQGYLFGRPVPLTTFMEALADDTQEVDSRFMVNAMEGCRFPM